MNRISSRLIVSLAVLVLVPSLAAAQRKTEQAAKPVGEEPVIKIYRVVDLVLPVPNYPYEGTYLPQMDANRMSSKGTTGVTMGGMGGGMGGMGGGMGGMGGGKGGGMFQVPDHLAQIGGGGMAGPTQGSHVRMSGAMGFSMGQLIEVITEIVEPSTWDEVGGPGTIQEIGGALAVRQLPAVHYKLEEFLEALQRESGALRMVTVKARWLSLDGQQRAQLAAKPDANEPASTPQALDPQALAALPADAQQFAGQITCFNGQTVHLISGGIKSVIGGAIPVVGSGIGYQPVMLSPHLGVLLQVTPSALPGSDGVLIDLHSTITRWDPPDEPTRISASSPPGALIEVDRINFTAEQFATSLRVPLDKPILVGGITYPAEGILSPDGQPAEKAAGPRRGLYLVIEVQSPGT